MLILNGVFATVYWKARDYVQDQVMSKAWLIVWFVGIPAISKSNQSFDICIHVLGFTLFRPFFQWVLVQFSF